MKIVFMGTPDFAVPALDALRQAGHIIGAVVTATDKMGGRGNKQLIESDVKKYAVAHNLPILQPEKLRNEDFLAALRQLNADLFVIVAFRMLPEVVWTMPPLGTINLHGSLLPKYRGAAPINWAIIKGETETGVSTFFLQHAIDTGNILAQAQTPIAPNENFGDIYTRLSAIGADLLVTSIQKISDSETVGLPQNEDLACPAPKLFQHNTQIDFTQTAQEVHNFVRGLSPHPAAWTLIDDTVLKVFETTLLDQTPELLDEIKHLPVGTILTDCKKYVKVICRGSVLALTNVQLSQKKRMGIKDFLNGYTIKNLHIGTAET
jgi:methionyl-tRNA formyltransferase